jgi:hypothetical protein
MAQKRSDRWAYMAHPFFNPPNDRCPECTSPSKTYSMGSMYQDGKTIRSWECEYKHRWDIVEGG